MSSERCRDLKKERRGEARTSTAWWTRAPCRPPVHGWTREESPFPAVLARLCGCHLVAEPAVELEGGSVELVHLQREHALFTPAIYQHPSLFTPAVCSHLQREHALGEDVDIGEMGSEECDERRTIVDKLGQKGKYDASHAPSGDGEAPHVVQPELERRAFAAEQSAESGVTFRSEYHAADDPVSLQRTEAERVLASSAYNGCVTSYPTPPLKDSTSRPRDYCSA